MVNHEFDKTYKISKKGDFVLVNEEIIASQKGVLKEVIKLFFKNFSIINGLKQFSMPIKIFQGSTYFEAYCKSYSNFQYIARAVAALDPRQTDPRIVRSQRLERLKCIAAFMLSGNYHVSESRKPFNLYLGETMQGQFQDGTKFYFERLDHGLHSDALFFENKTLGVKFYGSLLFKRE